MVNLITEHIDIWSTAQTQKNNGGRGRGKNSNSQSPHGIKKLRELILELAVRGKLEPQDPNDEPASVLLEKIAKDKARLIKEGKTKKQKPFSEISEDEKPFELPEEWEWSRIGDVGHDWGQKKPDNDFTYIEVSGIDNVAGIVRSLNRLTAAKAPSRARKIVKVGTVIYSTVRPYLQNICVIEQEYSPEPIASTAFAVLHPFQNMPGKFFTSYLRSPVFVNYVESVQTGIAYPAINDKQFFCGVIPIPPLAEQQRIVVKVDELMALCDHLEQQHTDSNATHQTLIETLLSTLTNATNQKEFAQAWQRIANHFDTLFTTEQSIDQLKQTILQLAVMGKLVPQDPMDLPASVRASHADGLVRASHADGPQSGKFFVYALECEDKSIYIGQTNDILNRWKEHAKGEGADWTKKHPPLRLVHWEEYNSREEAITREKELKTGFGRKWLKRELAAGRTRQAGEPASVLLEKISAEKARIIKEGKIKKQKLLPEISDEEKSFELPNGWEWARLQTLVFLLGDGLHGTPNYTPGTSYYFINGNNLNNGKIEIKPSTKSVSFEEMLKHKKDLSANTVLVSINGTLGNVAFYNDEKIILGKSACYFNLSEYVSKHFIKKVIESPYFMSYAFRNATGSTIKNLSLKAMNGFPVLLPPLAEQQRIVAKVDELMALCDVLKAWLNDAQTSQVQLADAIVEQAVA